MPIYEEFSTYEQILIAFTTPSTFVNDKDVWLSSDSSEGVSSLKLCVPGYPQYRITTSTANETYAKSDELGLKMAIFGSLGSFTTDYFSSFSPGSAEVFLFDNYREVGEIQVAWALIKSLFA